MKRRKDYQAISSLDKKIRGFIWEKQSLAIFNGLFEFNEQKLLMGWQNDLYAFCVAENEVVGLTDEEIEALFVLEGI